MALIFTIAAKDFRQRLRDRSAFIIGIVAPLLLAGIISAAIGSSFTKFHATFAVADLDHGPIASAFVDGVLHSPQVARISLETTSMPRSSSRVDSLQAS